MTCRIGSLNCRNFKNHEKKDCETITKIIRGEMFDICALQEIEGKRAMENLINILNAGSADGKWEGFHEQDSENRSKDTTGNNHYEYAFIWNTDKIRLPIKEHKYQYITYKNKIMPDIVKKYKILDKENGQKQLRYEPLYGRFKFGDFANTKSDELPSPLWELRIINTHLMFSKGKKNAENDIGQLLMRRNELDVLIKNIYHRISDFCYKDSSAETAYTILLGDYNMNKKDSHAEGNPLCSRLTFGDEYEIVCIIDGSKSKKIVTMQSELSTFNKMNENEEISGALDDCLANNYDHFTYDEGRFRGVKPQISRVDITKYCKNNDFRNYYKEVSDHLPIMIELDFNE